MHVPDFPVGMLVADAEPVLLAQVAYEVAVAILKVGLHGRWFGAVLPARPAFVE